MGISGIHADPDTDMDNIPESLPRLKKRFTRPLGEADTILKEQGADTPVDENKSDWEFTLSASIELLRRCFQPAQVSRRRSPFYPGEFLGRAPSPHAVHNTYRYCSTRRPINKQ